MIDGERWFCLHDDAMISMRYARNIARGLGPVWNPGDERVEGFSNPAWTGLMAIVHLTPLDDRRISLAIQLTGMLLLGAGLVAVARLANALAPRQPAAAPVAVLLTGASLALNTWGLQGMEVSALALITTVATLRAVSPAGARPDPVLPWLLAGATTIRLDAAVPAASLAMALWALGRRRDARAVVVWTVIALAGQTALRWAVFGDWLPNPARLKLDGVPLAMRLDRGWRTTAGLIHAVSLPVFAGLALHAWLRRDRRWIAPWAAIAGQVAYSTWVGGDVWDWWAPGNRFVSQALPTFFSLVAVAATDPMFLSPRWRTTVPRVMRCGVPVIWLLARLNRTADAERPYGPWLLRSPSLDVGHNARNVMLGRWLRNHTNPDTAIAVTWAGALPYVADRRCVDLLGKCDRVVAAGQPRREVPFIPGHNKWNAAHSFGRMKPDIVAHGWPTESPPIDAQPYARSFHPTVLPWRGIIHARPGKLHPVSLRP